MTDQAVLPPDDPAILAETLDEPPLVIDRRKRSLTLVDILGPLVVLGLFVAWWYWMHHWALVHVFGRSNGDVMPPPHKIIDESFIRGREQPSGRFVPRSEMFKALWVTVKLTFIGLGCSILIGTFIAVLMTPFRWLERSLWPYLVALQAVPILVISPLLGVIFDYGFSARLVVVVIISIVPIISNTLFGLRSAEPGQHDLFTLKSASAPQRLFKLQLPAALPAIFTGYRISAGLAVIGAIVGELFMQKGQKGIGLQMEVYRSRTIYTFTFGALLLSSLLGIAVFALFGLLQRFAIGKWYQPATGAPQ